MSGLIKRGGDHMKHYEKPILVKFTDDEMSEIIFAGASCPNCYNGCSYTVNSGNCVSGCGRN